MLKMIKEGASRVFEYVDGKLEQVAAGTGLAVASSFAMATGPDVTAITAAGADVATVGTAVFAVYVAIRLVKWIRRAL